MTTKKAKKMTFRQRLRATAEERLSKMTNATAARCMDVCKESKTEINPYDVMRLAAGKRNESLHYRLVSELANEMEAELERIYNNQQDLPLEDKHENQD